MAQILKGKDVVESMNAAMKTRVEALAAKGIIPTLGIVRLGERPDDISYEKGASKRCATVGVAVKNYTLPADTGQDKLLALIKEINADTSVHGVLLFRPLPKTINEQLVRNALAPEKDIDGITDGSLAGVFTNTKTGYPPCTAEACMEILAHYGVEIDGRRITVIGRSLVIGRPVAMMLMHKNGTVTVCHTHTKNVAEIAKEADIIIAAAGVPECIGADSLRPGQTVIDVGIHVKADGKMCGDVRFEEAENIVAAITPVPGGVGTVTTSVSVRHVIEAAEKGA
jgi:methylenetetrahydrofolate dehydrogenase (NADP+)/methenyltetrahydrofolate cyclohydrolase